MSERKKKLERYHLDRFKGAFPDFPAGKITHDDEPDFLVDTSIVTQGIEVTQIFRETPEGRRPMQEQESLRREILERVKCAYDTAGHPPVCVSVSFALGDSLAKKNLAPLAKKLLVVVTRAIPEAGGVRDVDYEGFGEDELPDVFDRVSIYRRAEYKTSYWSAPDAAFVPGYGPEHLQAIISGKNARAGEYRKRATVLWLLIVADGSGLSSHLDFSETTWTHEYVANFERVFYFDNIDRKVAELRKSYSPNR